MRTARSSSRPGGLHQTHPWVGTPLDQTPREQAPRQDQAPPLGPGTPHLDRQTPVNITLPQTSFAGDNKI